jgi:protein-S-isoprenylcysteine O-methyltransferase Ste14
VRPGAAALIALLWLAWGAYWLASARGTKPVRRREPPWSRVAHLGPLAVATLLLVLPPLPGWLGARWHEPRTGTALAAAALVGAGLALTVWARVTLGGNWSATVTLKQDHRIVTAGPYRRVRHPIYTGLIVAFAGTALVRGDGSGLFALVIVVAALWRKLRLEERWLADAFGAAYTDYARRTRALLPWPW